MKDSNDKQTIELLDKPRPGRPSTGKAKTQAQIQREYRQRKKAQKQAAQDDAFIFSITLTRHELSAIVHGLDREYKGLKAIGHPTLSGVDQLRECLRALVQGKTKGRSVVCPAVELYLSEHAS